MSANERPRLRSGPVSLADEERVTELVVGSILGLWDVVNDLTRLKPTRRDRYRVTIFGSARALPEASATRKRNGWPRRSPRWGATSSPAADPG